MPDEEPPEPSFPIERLFHGMLGQSDAMRAVFRKITRYGPAQAPVLITGETGTGKELVARALHRHSDRRSRPWVAVNCSALNEDLFESELFGHERGAFTGAITAHKGRFERANTGSLFLDEAGDMPLRVQSKLLRVLEHGTFERVGGEREIHADVRILAATNVPLERAVQRGAFRSDLYHRIAVLRIHVPPLRDRLDDVPLLAEFFLRQFNDRYGRAVRRISPEALHALTDYPWPGNVRELRNVLERVYVESVSDVIGRGAFSEWEAERDLLAAGAWNLELRDNQRYGAGAPITPGAATSPEAQAEAARALAAIVLGQPVYPLARSPRGADSDEGEDAPGQRIVQVPVEVSEARDGRPKELTEEDVRSAYSRAQGNITRAAALLGCHKATVYRALERLGLSRADLDA